MLISKTYWGGMPFWFRKPPAHAQVESLVLRAHDLRQLRALYWTSSAHPAPRLGLVIMHPRVDFTQHYAIPRLVEAGFAVLAAQTRHAGNDTMAEHEEMVLDVGACVRHLREKRGVEHVVLFGNCGGASLSAFYQAQALTAPAERLRTSPGGFPTFFESAPLAPADAVIFTAPHRGQGKVMLAAIDPSITDERDPLSCDPALDMYAPANGFAPPPAWSSYAPEFLARYRAAQHARVERLDAYARAQLEAARTSEDPRRKAHDPVMVVYRTMANPQFVDRAIDPSDRDYGSLLSERPDLMNYAALGLARTCTPRAWLSTWSGLSSNADMVANVAKITSPTLVIHAGRDREIFPADLAAIAGAAAAADKQVHTVADARHYFEPELGEKTAPHVEACMDLVIPWIRERFSTGASRSRASAAPAPTIERHPTTATWTFPPVERPVLGEGLARINLKELAARPERFEHHLVVVAQLGCAQLEVATASEPLYFAHVNISDEYAVALPTGDPLLDAFPMRTFVSDRVTGADVGRYNHRAGDLVLHPHGYAHWPGKLRPPYQGLDIPPGMRRCGVSLVYCASVPTPSTAEVVALPAGRKLDDVKPYAAGPTLSLADLFHGAPGVVARIGDTTLALVDRPTTVAPPRGGWVVILAGTAPHATADLIRIAPGAALAGDGIERALVLAGDAEPGPVPPAWTALPPPPFPRFEDGTPGTLPFEHGGIRIEAGTAGMAMVSIPDGTSPAAPRDAIAVPRYWLARMLYRTALHDLRLNHVETYGGFFLDDSGDDIRIGIRSGERARFVTIPRAEARAVVERLYRAVAPADYTERLA